jgi:arabinofuranosyltransferase
MHENSGQLAAVDEPRSWIARGAALLLCGIGLWHLYCHASYTLDDAYISFRYARNLARGMGLVYNPGEYVKGYSNTLYTLLMVVPELFGHDPIWLSRSLGVLSFMALCWFGCRHYAREHGQAGSTDRGLWLVALLAVSTSVAVHCITGLETGLHAALVFAAIVTRLREQRDGGRPWSALLCVAVVWSRPEGMLLFAAMACQDALVRIRSRSIGRFDLVWYLLPPLAYAGELGLSQLYYGAPLPQTYHAKTRTVSGAGDALLLLVDGLAKQFGARSYLAEGLAGTGWGFAALGVAALALVAPARRMQNLAFVSVSLAQIVFIARAGSDWAPGFRFGMPMLPLLFVLVIEAAAFVSRLARGHERALSNALLGIALALAIAPNLSASREIAAKKYVDGGGLLLEGEMLRKLAEPGITLASYDIGGQGYAAGGFDILDAAGLTVRETAKCRGKANAQCRRAVALLRPELVRRHPSRSKDAYVADAARKTGAYVEFEEGRYLLRRSLVLVERVPEWATQLAGDGPRTAVHVAAHDMAPVLRSGQETSVTLYWRQGTTPADAAAATKPAVGADHATPVTAAGSAAEPAVNLHARRLSWVSAAGAGRHPARESEVLWSVANPEGWARDELFADFVVLHAPPVAGRYELRAQTQDGRELPVGSVEVVDAHDVAPRARALIGRARAALGQGAESLGLRLLMRAAQLDRAGARAAYQQATVQTAQRLRREADAVAISDRSRALRLLQRAKVQLHRAYWESGRALPTLREEIDDNARLRRRLIAAELRDEAAHKT